MLPATPKTRRFFLIVSILLVASIVVIGLYWIIAKKKTSQRATMPVAVGVAVVKKEDAPLQLNALGTVTSTYTATVKSRVDGQLMKLHFVEGQLVKEGQLLAELDSRPFQASLKQAEGQLARDEALLQNAKLDLDRYRKLLSQKSIAKQQVDTQESLVRQYAGTVKLDRGAVETARLQLVYSRITAPISGRVGLRQVDLGNIVHSSDTNGIVIITQVQPINVVFAIPEINLSQVLEAYGKDQRLKVEAWDRDNKAMLSEGYLLAIDNQLNTSTGTINLKSKFENKDMALFPNQFVNARLLLGVQPEAITVPTAAIQLGKVGSYVYVVYDDQTVKLQKVKLGPVSGDNTIITEGLKPGQFVVVDGLDKLRDGAQIKMIDRANASKASKNDQASASHPKEEASTGAAKPSGPSASAN